MATKEPRAGVLTSEFWLAVLVVVSATVLLSLGTITAEDWRWAVTGASGIYAAARAYTKAQGGA